MDARVVVLTPWRGDGGQRDRLYAAVGPYVAELGWPVIEGHSGDEVFSLARTWNHLAATAGDWDVAVLHEADYFVEHGQIRAAVAAAVDGYPGQVYAYDRHVKLNQAATARFLTGKRGPWGPQDRRIGKHRTGGPRVVSRALWEAVGGFHDGFVGWGYEDNAFRDACERISPPLRVPGDLVNLWHPKHDPNNPYWRARDANYALFQSLRRS